MKTLPSGWRSSTLGEVATVVRGVTYKKPQASESPGLGLVPLLRATNIADDLRLDSGLLYVPKAIVKTDQLLRHGDILAVASSGSVSMVGRSARLRAEWEGTFGAFCTVVRPGPNIDAAFLALYLKSEEVRRRWSDAARGTNINNLKAGDLLSTVVPLPPREEQRRIVAILDDHLSRLDQAIKLIRRSHVQLDIMDRVVIDDVMVRRAGEQGWPVVPLGQLAGDKRAMTDGPFGSHLTTAHYSGAGARVVRLQNIGDGQYKDADAFIDLDHYALLEKHDVIEGDVVIASLGDSLPRAAVVPDLDGPAIVKADCIRVRLPKAVEAEWAVLACRSTRAKDWAKDRLHGVGRQRLGLGGIREIPIPMPADSGTRRALLDWILDQLEHSNLLRIDLDRELKRGENLRRSVLSAAFAGKLTSQSQHESTEEVA